MPWWIWIPLGLLASTVVAAAVQTLFAYGRIKRLQATGGAIAARAEEVARSSEELEVRLDRASGRADEIERHLDRLRESLERLSVLSWALGDARKGIARLRGAYLRK